jgi:hypothetical protein
MAEVEDSRTNEALRSCRILRDQCSGMHGRQRGPFFASERPDTRRQCDARLCHRRRSQPFDRISCCLSYPRPRSNRVPAESKLWLRRLGWLWCSCAPKPIPLRRAMNRPRTTMNRLETRSGYLASSDHSVVISTLGVPLWPRRGGLPGGAKREQRQACRVLLRASAVQSKECAYMRNARKRTSIQCVRALPADGARNFAEVGPLSLVTTEATMARSALLWLVGVPIPIILLLWLFWH